MNLYRHRCDGCNREVEAPGPGAGWGRLAADGWYVVEGVYGGGEPYDQYHLCSIECVILWANRLRMVAGSALVPAFGGSPPSEAGRQR